MTILSWIGAGCGGGAALFALIVYVTGYIMEELLIFAVIPKGVFDANANLAGKFVSVAGDAVSISAGFAMPAFDSYDDLADLPGNTEAEKDAYTSCGHIGRFVVAQCLMVAAFAVATLLCVVTARDGNPGKMAGMAIAGSGALLFLFAVVTFFLFPFSCVEAIAKAVDDAATAGSYKIEDSWYMAGGFYIYVFQSFLVAGAAGLVGADAMMAPDGRGPPVSKNAAAAGPPVIDMTVMRKEGEAAAPAAAPAVAAGSDENAVPESSNGEQAAAPAAQAVAGDEDADNVV
ncbi:unnamed protein product [Amoebophrya sp. A120]|nr:unnamed protein product [Amoebophrya sp. A120]|eukprot:GSA120T00000229001.1